MKLINEQISHPISTFEEINTEKKTSTQMDQCNLKEIEETKGSKEEVKNKPDILIEVFYLIIKGRTKRTPRRNDKNLGDN